MGLRTAFVLGTSLMAVALSASAEDIDAETQGLSAFKYSPLDYIYIPEDAEYYGDKIDSVMDLPFPRGKGNAIDGRIDFVTSSNKTQEDPVTGETTYGVMILGHLAERRELYNISLDCRLVNDEEFAGTLTSLLNLLPSEDASFADPIFAFCGDVPIEPTDAGTENEVEANAGFQTMYYMSESGAYLMEVVKESQRNPLSPEDFVPVEDPLNIAIEDRMTYQAG